MVNIVYKIHGDIPEAGLLFNVSVDSEKLTLPEIQQLFPFEGKFHFRKRLNDSWLDLVDSNENLLTDDMSRPPVNSLEIQALVLSLPQTYVEKSAYDLYYDAVETELSRLGLYEDGRQKRVVVGSIREPKSPKSPLHNYSSADKIKSMKKEISKQLPPVESISLESATGHALNLWNTVKTTASTIHQNVRSQLASKLSDISEENLSLLSDDLSTPFSDINPRHMAYLTDLWNGLSPKQAFQRNSSKWKEAGFQSTDPTVDLRASGVLALRAMTYLCEKYPDRSQRMLQANKTNVSTNYPFAVVGINITLMLADIIGLKDAKYLSIQSSYWELFENRNSFYEMFCICFLYLDNIWTSRKAVRGVFGKLMLEVKSAITSVLDRSPKMISELRSIAAQAGMM
mmetsp:Transcript_39633/g.40399  ORF Transcript_39633/g.40399 Transcript_39633/m.40399 type:complete len:399 (+) Transcript_39633:91-1287(+)|eukprot:CAMPEP_0182429170 /NCGR_PEP_ID=MMETSP1167-20130531/25545_1 /TAXON_ID=2988 /ORGANISM="Mallomonas Sp, Strain CCMP3275" /LENGTH=398 /DNA_ID=CAMNT_0024612533 /DNA_START=63 /DNA_END=1259 /DNA_ORIENTATION=-